MAENNKFLTESFELVVSDFYNAAEAANPTPPQASTTNTFEIETIARAIIDRFQHSVSLGESGKEEEVGSSVTIEPVIDSVDETGMPDVTERESSGVLFVVVESPESPPPGSLLHQTPNLSPVSEENELLKRCIPDVHETSHDADRDTMSHLYLRTWNPSHVIDFEWALENFSQYREMTQSSKFSAENCKRIWEVSIVISKIPEEHADCLELLMKAMFEFKGTIYAHFDLGVYSKKGECFQEGVTTATFTEDRRRQQCLVAKDPFARSAGDNVATSSDEIIIKGRIKLTGCCLKTERFNEPKLEAI